MCGNACFGLLVAVFKLLFLVLITSDTSVEGFESRVWNMITVLQYTSSLGATFRFHYY
jgi:hypothetical protein